MKDNIFLSEWLSSLGNFHTKDMGLSSPDWGFALKRENWF